MPTFSAATSTCTTTVSIVVIQWGPPPCTHPAIHLIPQPDELQVACPYCKKTIAIARAQVEADLLGHRTRMLIWLAFGNQYDAIILPWVIWHHRFVLGRAVGWHRPPDIVRTSRYTNVLRYQLGILAWWIYYHATVYRG